MTRKPFADKELTIFLAVLKKNQMKAIERLAKKREVTKSRALRILLESAIKIFKI